MNTFNPLDDHYKKKFKDWSVQPRNDMWADIQKRMESENKEKPVPFWMSINNNYYNMNSRAKNFIEYYFLSHSFFYNDYLKINYWTGIISDYPTILKCHIFY